MVKKNMVMENVKNTLNEELTSNDVRVASLDSGAGLFDKGFYDEGFKLEFALVRDEDSAETYKANLGDHVVIGDLRDYDMASIHDAEVLITKANHVHLGKVIEAVESMKSLKVFVVKCPAQVITYDENGKMKTLNDFFARMSDYDITMKKVVSSNYGSAQQKSMLIVIGSKIGPIELPDTLDVKPKTVREAFEGITPDTPNQMDYTNLRDRDLEAAKHVPQGGNYKDVPNELISGYHRPNTLYRLEWDTQSLPISHVRKSKILHPEEHRILSIRECARLFDLFPDKDGNEFIFRGTLSSMHEMLWLDVPVSISSTIAKEVKNKFSEVYGDQYKFKC